MPQQTLNVGVVEHFVAEMKLIVNSIHKGKEIEKRNLLNSIVLSHFFVKGFFNHASHNFSNITKPKFQHLLANFQLILTKF